MRWCCFVPSCWKQCRLRQLDKDVNCGHPWLDFRSVYEVGFWNSRAVGRLQVIIFWVFWCSSTSKKWIISIPISPRMKSDFKIYVQKKILDFIFLIFECTVVLNERCFMVPKSCIIVPLISRLYEFLSSQMGNWLYF